MADIGNVVISDCENLQDTCPFIRGFNKSIELDFTPSKSRLEFSSTLAVTLI